MQPIRELQETIGYTFRNPALLRTALTHPSHGARNNQRLEFLGDAVLELCVSRLLFERTPVLREGDMTRTRAALVKEDTLYAIARGIRLGQYINMDKACAAGGGRDNKSILSDALEAVLAGVFLDGGLDAADTVIHLLWHGLLKGDSAASDPKGALQEYLQSKGLPTPTYVTLEESGPAHKRRFQVGVLIDGAEAARAEASSKKRAELEAARLALNLMLKAGAGNEA
ncbi:MAG: ribonuclease III [Clostridiales bacterium]|nr:ribonuclease III [Eubacteriales bacterium]MDD4709720.1 ribonuclease III [Eubacteriales bacterium]NLO14473.1 ribonuclease III [Clostridiales bacterium]